MQKVVLTEEQFKRIVIEEMINSGALVGEPLLNYLLTESVDIKHFIQSIKSALAAGAITVAMASSFIDKSKIPESEKEEIKSELSIDNANDTSESTNIDLEKADACKQYMEWAAKNVGKDPTKIQLDPMNLVKSCNETGFDLPLLLAQAHMESCFGLTPRAQKTNSVFSVGLYDNGNNAASYETQDASVLPYIKIVQNNYLRDRSVDQMLEPGQFVNQNNQRYASSQNYENSIKSIRNRILRMYPILGE